jgi:hypothetical protein
MIGRRASGTSGCAVSPWEYGRSGAAVVSRVPHWRQKRLPVGFAVEQDAQTTTTEAPHWLQKRLPSGVVAWQRGQIIEHVLSGDCTEETGLGREMLHLEVSRSF